MQFIFCPSLVRLKDFKTFLPRSFATAIIVCMYYDRYREFCEMKPIKYWTDLYGIMPNHTILAYSRIYEDPEVSITINITISYLKKSVKLRCILRNFPLFLQDMDLFTAGVSEIPLQGRLLGKTFHVQS